MTITKGEFTRFTTSGRLQLLRLYGQSLLKLQLQQHQITIYQINNFYVADIITQQAGQLVQTTEPITESMLSFYRSVA